MPCISNATGDINEHTFYCLVISTEMSELIRNLHSNRWLSLGHRRAQESRNKYWIRDCFVCAGTQEPEGGDDACGVVFNFFILLARPYLSLENLPSTSLSQLAFIKVSIKGDDGEARTIHLLYDLFGLL